MKKKTQKEQKKEEEEEVSYIYYLEKWIMGLMFAFTLEDDTFQVPDEHRFLLTLAVLLRSPLSV